jgi:hypothetical protein
VKTAFSTERLLAEPRSLTAHEEELAGLPADARDVEHHGRPQVRYRRGTSS